MSETTKWGGLDFPRSNNEGNQKIKNIKGTQSINYSYGVTAKNIMILRSSDTNKPVALYIMGLGESIHIQLEEIVSVELLSTTIIIKTEDLWTTYLIATDLSEAEEIERLIFENLNLI